METCGDAELLTWADLGDAVPVVATENLARAEWLSWRRRGIGGSDAAAICGQDPWRSRMAVWMDKVGWLPEVDERDTTEAMRWGNLLEDVVAAEVGHREPGLELQAVKAILVNPERPWQLANVDRVARLKGSTGIYEGKTVGHFSAGGWWREGKPEVPDHYLLQGMHYLSVTGLPWVIFGVLIAGQRLEVRQVDRDDELIAHLEHLEAEFWRLVEDRTPPPPDGSQATTELLSHLWDVKPGAIVTLDRSEVKPLLDERAEIVARQNALEAERNQVENELRVLIGEHEEAVDTDGRRLFTWRQVTRTDLDTKALVEAEPDVAHRFARTVAYRHLHVPRAVA